MSWKWLCKFTVVFLNTWFVASGLNQETVVAGDITKINCNDTKTLDECFNNLPPIKDHGIPANPQAVENACKVFDTGMECVDNWSKACLTKPNQELVKSSVIGALETYRFLCTDKKFRREYLQHADCYRRISIHWDACARKFIESLKRVDHSKDVLSLCCIRFRYLQCVTEVANHHCSKNATKFLQKLAESLVRLTMRNYQPNQCSNVDHRNCSVGNSAQSSTKFFSTSPSSFFHRILLYPTKGVINSLYVLQNLAFSDITTFFCALTRDLSPYVGHHSSNLEDTSCSTFPAITSSTNDVVIPADVCNVQEA